MVARLILAVAAAAAAVIALAFGAFAAQGLLEPQFGDARANLIVAGGFGVLAGLIATAAAWRRPRAARSHAAQSHPSLAFAEDVAQGVVRDQPLTVLALSACAGFMAATRPEHVARTVQRLSRGLGAKD